MTFEEQILRYTTPYQGIEAIQGVDDLLKGGVGTVHLSLQSNLQHMEWRATGKPPHAFMLHEHGAWFDDVLRDFTAKCRGSGVLPVVYICTHTLAARHLEKHPEAWHWLTTDEKGAPLLQALYVFGRSQRFQGCLNNPGWVQHLKEASERAMAVGFGGIFYDNPNWVWCYCRHCQEKFAAFLARQGREPAPIPHEPNWDDETWQQYEMFLCETVRGGIAALSAHLKARDPEFRIAMNTTPPLRISPAVRQLPSFFLNEPVDWIFYESSPIAGQKADGSFARHVDQLSYGAAEAEHYGKLLTPLFKRSTPLDQFFPNLVKLGMADGWAFRSSVTLSDLLNLRNFRQLQAVKPYFEFVREHARRYLESRTSASVGIYFSWPTMLRHLAPRHARTDPKIEFNLGSPVNQNPYPHFRAWCHLLAEAHVPFKTVLDLNDPGVDVLILPETAHVTEEEAARLRRLVAAGMGLVATGKTSLFDGSKERETYVLADLLGASRPPAAPVRRAFGSGRVCLLPDAPELRHAEAPSPALREELTGVLRWAAQKAAFPVEADAPEAILITTLGSAGRTLVNLVNHQVSLDDDRLTPVGEVTLRLTEKPAKVEWLTPDGPAGALEVEPEGHGYRVRVPRTEIYNLVVLDWSPVRARASARVHAPARALARSEQERVREPVV
ncbi:MAG: hypothetical protein HY321_01220 [Armatimonadetes bacterium]|nr:hypothetical protein [Armatimonadota bacterium]